MKNYKHLFFHEVASKTKTKVFEVLNKLSFCPLGFVKWYAPWRKYCYFIGSSNLVFDAECLADIQDFINTLMAERRGKNDDYFTIQSRWRIRIQRII